ncbi:MAG: hypothetical protein LRY76_08040 [Alphaproteobacteria bacterium]|nr:hypothetical protein [Alphaproteobacteria bacterium]
MSWPLTASALDSCVVPSGATYNIDEHSTCQSITNNHASGSDIMVPTKTATEWSSGGTAFLNALPANVTKAACSASCGAVTSCSAGGGGESNLYCWATQAAYPAPMSCGEVWTHMSKTGPCAVKDDGTLWCWDNTLATTPTQIPGNDWMFVSADGQSQGCAIKTDNTLWCWGPDNYGQCGDGNAGTTATVPHTAPVQVAGSWKFVARGDNQTCGIKTDDTGWCWGYNYYGQLGNGIGSICHQTSGCTTGAREHGPVAIVGGGTWKFVSVASRTSCGVKTDGTGWCWGRGDSGERGDGVSGANKAVSSPKAISGGGTWLEVYAAVGGLKTTGVAYKWGTTASAGGATPSVIAGGHLYKSISPGSKFCGVRTDGAIYCASGSGSYTYYDTMSPVSGGLNAETAGMYGRCALINSRSQPMGCRAPWGIYPTGPTVAPGGSFTAYLNGGTCAEGCTSETRTCNDGVLSGTYTTRDCTAGQSIGGYCWYLLGGSDKSCDTTCAPHGGCNLTGTRNYVGSSGTNANCVAVLQALGETASAAGAGSHTAGAGCYITGNYWRRNTTAATTCEVEEDSRACACNL